jgi:endo-1,4-beta-mannosidase
VPPYCPQYLDLVDYITSQFQGETRILAWEIGNELKLDPGSAQDMADFVAFNHSMARRIKECDPNHLVTTGMKSTQHTYMLGHRDLAEKLYSGRDANGRRLIDFITVHSYVDPAERPEEKRGFELDAQLAKALGMPIVVEETGVNRHAGDFRARLEEHMRRWFDTPLSPDEQPAYGFMQWGFCPKGVADGSSDNFDDRTVIKETYHKRGELLAV